MDTLEKLVFNLQTIASIPPGRRITTAQEFINIDDESVMQPLWRTIARDSRTKSVLAVRQTVETLILVTELMLESRHLVIEDADGRWSERGRRIEKIREITNLLDESRIGINNLRETYFDDTNVVAILQPLAVRIEEHVGAVSRALTQNGESLKKRIVPYL